MTGWECIVDFPLSSLGINKYLFMDLFKYLFMDEYFAQPSGRGEVFREEWKGIN